MEERQERVLVINVNLTRGLVALSTLALLVVALLSILIWGQREVAASGSQAPLSASPPMRQYYLASAAFDATYALSACVAGYHMASLWELLDTSHLTYNSTQGMYYGDSGLGPPTVLWGWVRTGYNSNNGSTAGQANCNAWSSTSGNGTYVSLPYNWTAAPQDIHVWTVGSTSCGSPAYVWCVED